MTLPSDSSDFCGMKIFKFQINAASTTFLRGNNSERIVYEPPAGKNSYGTQLVVL